MHSIRTKITVITVNALLFAITIVTLISVLSIQRLGRYDNEQMLTSTCQTGKMNLEYYFDSVENSVETVSNLVQSSFEGITYDDLDEQIERSRTLFNKVANNTNGVLTYYFRIDPEISKTTTGFWYVNLDGEGFEEHEVTDITLYDTNDTSVLTWFTIPKKTGKGVWLPPYYTDNLNVRVVSYNVPVYWKDRFIGVIGIEIDYKTIAQEVNRIKTFNQGYAFILDEKNNVIYHPQIDSSDLHENVIIPIPSASKSEDETIQYTYEGVDKIASCSQLSNGMRLYVSVPLSEVNKTWRNMIRNILVASIAILVIVSAVVLKYTKHIVKPLTELTEAAKKAYKGNFDISLTYDNDDEVGILTQTFNELASHTREHISNLNQKIYTDHMTGVKNKGGYSIAIQSLQERMDAKEENLKFAFGVFDCDNLKTINDRYGHDKGDIYLKTASSLISSVFKDSPVFRIGGDEFAVILENEAYEQRSKLIKEFEQKEAESRTATNQPWEKVGITMSFAIYDKDNDTYVIDVARRADKNMYQHKPTRRGQLPRP